MKAVCASSLRAGAVVVAFAIAAGGCGGVDEEIYRRDVNRLQQEVQDLQTERQTVLTERDKCIQDYNRLSKEKGELTSEMREAMEQIEHLRTLAMQREKMIQSIVASLHDMVAAGQVKVVKRQGRLVVEIPEMILFDVGKARLKPEGAAALRDLAPRLGEANRDFQVAGHTDTQGSAKVNWDLSLDRAKNVALEMLEAGYPPDRLSAAGYAFYEPVSPNDTTEGRQLNRRVEVQLVPDMEELSLDKLIGTSQACRSVLALAD